MHELPYDQLVVALGGAPRYELVPGARHELPLKSIQDAIALRTNVLDMFERATVERDQELREQLLRFVIVGGGLVGVELAGEMAPSRRCSHSAHMLPVCDHLYSPVPSAIAALAGTLRLSLDGTRIEGTTAIGRATVVALGMNHALIVAARRRWCGLSDRRRARSIVGRTSAKSRSTIPLQIA